MLLYRSYLLKLHNKHGHRSIITVRSALGTGPTDVRSLGLTPAIAPVPPCELWRSSMANQGTNTATVRNAPTSPRMTAKVRKSQIASLKPSIEISPHCLLTDAERGARTFTRPVSALRSSQLQELLSACWQDPVAVAGSWDAAGPVSSHSRRHRGSAGCWDTS